MIYHLYLLVLVGFACAFTSPAWKDDTEYVYLVNGRTLTSLHELADHYSGIFLKAKLHITFHSEGKYQAKITDAQYAQIHSRLTDGWHTIVPESLLRYKQLELSDKPFQILMVDGLIKSIIVEKEITNWEANVIKSIVSQFQLDIHGKNAIHSQFNTLPRNGKLEGTFKTMEETITGETETSYDMHRLPEYLIQSQPWLLPKQQLKEEGPVIEIIKNKNYTNSRENPFYHYGFGELTNGEPTSNTVGGLFSRQSNSRIILTGSLSRFTIHYAHTVNKIIINPTLNAKEQGSVVSTLNITLHDVKIETKQPQDLVNPVDIGSLVYTYETPFTGSNKVRQKLQGPGFIEDSSEETTDQSGRFRRSVDEMMQYQLRPTLGRAPEFPLLPYYMGYYGKSITTNKDFDIKKNVEKIVKEISDDLPNPEQILLRSTLSKYALLCSLVRSMHDEDINAVAEQLYTQYKKGPEYVMWIVFRDAVAEAGTGPAFLNIYKWIESHKIEKDEAAEVVASMANSVRVPTEEYMLKFFELIKNPRVMKQEYLNETALLSFTRLVNRVYVKKDESHNQYPVYSFKSFYTKEGKEFVKSIVLPYLIKQLHYAVSEADSRHIHVYIRALGNVGHRKILEAFEPYLEGQRQVSQFQRMLMVLSMDKLVVSEPSVARSVLYRVYSNTGEIPEVRVAAVYQLMRTVPPYEMIQRMAENTNIESQEQVNAAVKTAIEYASQLSSPASQKLRKSAESARHLLTKKEYGKQQSFNLLQDFVFDNMNIQFKHNLLQVGSVDHIIPKGIKYSVRGNINGMKHYFFNAQAMISSIKELINVFYKQTENYSQNFKHQSKEHQWSSAKIAESLNLQTNEREQLEGFIYSEIESLQRIWSFDNHSIEQLPQVIREQQQMLMNGKEFSYVKLRQLKEIDLSFPTEMGFPFLYTYDMPLLVRFEGKVKATANPEISKNNKLYLPKNIFGEIDAVFTVGTKIESHLSLVTPFDHQIYMSGIDKNAQLHFPLKGKVDIDLANDEHHVKFELEVKEDNKDARLLHYSSWPYTSRSDIMSLKPVALRPNTHRIRLESNNHRSFDFIVGQKEAGLSFRVWGHHPQQSYNLLKLYKNLFKLEGIASIWQQIWDESSLEQTEASIAFIPSDSTTRKVIFNFSYQTQYESQSANVSKKGFWDYIWGSKKTQNNGGYHDEEKFWTMDQLSSKVEHDTTKYRQKIMTYVGAGIKSAQLYFFNAFVEFQGERKYEHNFTVAAAKSNVAPQSRIVTFYENNAPRSTSGAVQIKCYIGNTNELDLSYSLNMAPKSNCDVLVQYGENELRSSKVRAKLNFTRSSARRQYLEERPLYQICKRQMQEGNHHLPACQNMTIESNYQDEIRVELQYENFKKECANYIFNIFKGARFFYYPMTDIKTIETTGQNKVNLTIQFQPDYLRKVNISVRSNNEETKLYNLAIGEMGKTVFVPHPLFNLKTRMLGQYGAHATCVLDNKSTQTFSNRTYPLSLGSGLTLMMMYVPQEALPSGQTHQQPVQQLKMQQENFAVLVRQSSADHREVMITFNHPKTEGKTVEITMKPNKQKSNIFVSVFVDGKEVKFDDQQAATQFNGFVEVYAFPNGEVKLEIQDWFYIVFDGHRVKLTATSNKLRDSMVGLCGRFSQDRYEDFWTPNNCVVRSAEKFVDSFVVMDRKRKQSQLEYQECIPKVLPLYADVVSDFDVERKESRERQSSTGTRLRTRYLEENGEICFTMYPMPQCKNYASALITRNVPVYCMEESDNANLLKTLIEKGSNPDFSGKSKTKDLQFQIPQQCE